jgi:methyltransferase-like protein
MENITLGQIALALTFLLSISGNITSLIKTIKSPIDKKLQSALEPVNKKIDNLNNKLDDMEKEHMKKLNNLELDSIRNDLVNYMSLAEEGFITPKTKIDMYELYDAYCKMGGNSYVHDKWEKLKEEGKI